MNTEQTSIGIKFGTKAETLESLKPLLQKSVVDDLIKFSVLEWKDQPNEIITAIQKKFSGQNLAVRSSAINEDSFTQSNAGHFRSVLNVTAKNAGDIEAAVNRVISSYSDENNDHQIFVQSFLDQVQMSGVIFTRDLNTFSPYVTINYDDQTGLTDTVTSGQGKQVKTLVMFKEKFEESSNPIINHLFDAIIELEKLFNNDALDIEFAYKDNLVHILQVRPIVKKNENFYPDTEAIKSTLRQIYNRIGELGAQHPDLYGNGTLYGIMPDWNPAEMIGVKPRPLALSLYRELITDSVWAYQRDNYGYKRLRSFPLLVSFAGHPYVDVRVDFNSWIPKNLDDALSHKLANYYLNKLRESPASHDKIEFEIVYTCYTFDLKNKLNELLSNGFSRGEVDQIGAALLELTKNIIGSKGEVALYKDDLKKIDILEQRRETLLSSSLSDVNKIYWLIEDCKRYGTLPFAGIARAGFVAVLFLNSLVDLKIISLDEKNRFINSLNTVAKQLSADIRSLKNGLLSQESFLAKYGHLRPGTYDVLLDSYAENFEKYFDLKELENTPVAEDVETEPFTLSNYQKEKIQTLLNEHGLGVSCDEFFSFLRDAIEGREYGKFSFTKSVSELIFIIKKYGAVLGFGAEEMSYVEIGTIIKFYSTVAYFDEKELLTKEIERNKNFYNFYHYLKLPHLINKPSDIFSFYLDNIEPNFVTTGSVEGELVKVETDVKKADIVGKIVFIENADPGFDWIFSHHIKGLVTMYGGANSHMSIRAAELNIAAVIGCGSLLFDRWSAAKTIKLDCATKKVVVLS